MDLKQIEQLKSEIDIIIEFTQKMQSIQQKYIDICNSDNDFYMTTGKLLIENRQKLNIALVDYAMVINDLYRTEIDLIGLVNNIK